MSRADRPEAIDVIRAHLDLLEQDMHTCLIARVQSYDAARQVADLVPVVRHAVEQPDGTTAYEELPVLPHVPIAFPRAGAWFLSMPLAAGDFVVVHVLDASSEHWRAGDGSAQFPGDVRRRSLGSCVAYPANFYPGARALANASGTDLVLGKDDGTRIVIKPSAAGVVEVAGGADFVALAGATDTQLAALRAAVNALASALSLPAPFPPAPPVPSVGAQRLKST